MHGPNDNRAGAQGALTMDELPWRSVPGGSIGMVTPATLAGHILPTGNRIRLSG